jgi:hypothetical protein
VQVQVLVEVEHGVGRSDELAPPAGLDGEQAQVCPNVPVAWSGGGGGENRKGKEGTDERYGERETETTEIERERP